MYTFLYIYLYIYIYSDISNHKLPTSTMAPISLSGKSCMAVITVWWLWRPLAICGSCCTTDSASCTWLGRVEIDHANLGGKLRVFLKVFLMVIWWCLLVFNRDLMVFSMVFLIVILMVMWWCLIVICCWFDRRSWSFHGISWCEHEMSWSSNGIWRCLMWFDRDSHGTIIGC